MTNPAFTPTGLVIRTFDEIFQDLVARVKAIYGNDISVEPNTPDGQRLAILAQLVLDMETFCLNLYNQMDADLSAGDWLNKLIKFAGIYRRPTTRSQVDVTVTTDRTLTLTAGYTIRDDLDQQWVLPDNVDLGAGAFVVTFVAADFGDVTAAPNTVRTPETIIIGVTDVNNVTAALVGRDEETDEDLRVRRDNSVENPAYSTTGSLMAKLADLASVVDVVVYENDTDVLDVDRNMVAHSIWVVCEGGGTTEITETMVKQKTGGCATKGAEIGIYNETVLRPDGSEFVIVHEMKFDRPEIQPLKIRLTATRLYTTSPIDLDSMKANLVAVKTKIGVAIKASQLYAPAYKTGQNFVLSDLEISNDGGTTWTDGELSPDYDGKFSILTANIAITEVIP